MPGQSSSSFARLWDIRCPEPGTAPSRYAYDVPRASLDLHLSNDGALRLKLHALCGCPRPSGTPSLVSRFADEASYYGFLLRNVRQANPCT